MKGMPPIILALLASSLVLTIGRGITLPFITIYLTEHYHLLPKSVGAIMGASLALGILSSLYGGYLVDKFNHRTLIAASISFFSLSFFLLPILPSITGVLVVLALLNSSYALLSITIKACIASWLPVDKRVKAFSMNYTLINVGWAVGSSLGVWLAGFSPMLPFLISGGLALVTVITLSWGIRNIPNRPAQTEIEQKPLPKPNLRQTLSILAHDRRLIYFTLGSTLGSIVFGQFTGYLSQYLILTSDAVFAYKVIGAVMITNALIVIVFQYALSSRMRQATLLRWLFLGTVFFMIGLAGFMLAGPSVLIWVIAMAIFSFGELIVIPAEYMFIDFIAPDNMKGSYYGMQNLSNLGGAINPVLCGFLLSYTAPPVMFIVLIASAAAGLLFFWLGHRLAVAN
ncbi:MAG: MFS transporter [Ewingella americana]|uniref:MFS transporter n=1 Tax=Ewingella americana TaxID=41202 RepID=UPI002433214E|nr:MFS transporter [Ewingella americana]MCI1679825.1 MFS transporter [Ewingella americana]MCI1855509.1 MFS transporter [Ewingella americana]MCI1862997.1 MFS transporter [Ewingella americana]MCI2140671.1 MFS transporter [Ewingella americana]MCI2165821.1 MFS transporter [Ewingella americana]